mgnify:CR=1 FL=1
MIRFYLMLVISVNASLSSARETVPLNISQGRLLGVLLEGTTGLRVFRGIPYAKPPLGALRWRPPQLAEAWEGLRICDQFGAAPPQKLRDNDNNVRTSEDCLYLNVWTKQSGNRDAKLPVMVWIHGGGLNQGWGHKAYSDGVGFATRDVVFVSINYRLGALGYLAHPTLSSESAEGVSGNYGFLDQIEALKWVQKNIGAFGGDSDNVTIFGESAGGTSVSVLCASPLAKGLFHRAIIQSPWMFGYINKLAEPNIVPLKNAFGKVPAAETIGRTWADGLSLEALRSLSTEEILAKDSYYKTRASIDGWCLPAHPTDVFAAGKQADVPTIIGTTKDEGLYFANWAKFEDRAAFASKLQNFYGRRADQVLNMYPGESAKDLRRAAVQFITDSWFVQPARQLLEGMSQVPSATYQYEFAQNNRDNPSWGAPHAAELKYVFNTHLDSVDDSLAALMVDLWVQFARTGNPNREGLPVWPVYDAERSFLRIADNTSLGKDLNMQTCDALDTATEGMYAQAPTLPAITSAQRNLIEDGVSLSNVAQVVQRGQVLHHLAADSKREGDPAITDDTLFAIWSMTKPITSVAAMVLHERGMFQLDDAVSIAIPELAKMTVKNKDGSEEPIKRAITYRDLFRHTSGIYGYDGSFDEVGTWKEIMELNDLSEMVDLLAAQPLKHQPGDHYTYGMSTAILGRAIEILSEKSLASFLEDELFKPLGMDSSHFHLTESNRKRLQPLFVKQDGDFRPGTIVEDELYYQPGSALALGGEGLISNMKDYGKFCQMLVDRGKTPDGTSIISEQTLSLMLTHQLQGIPGNGDEQPINDFGLGFYVLKDATRGGQGAPQGIYGWGGYHTTHFWIDPVNELYAIFMTRLYPTPQETLTSFRRAVYEGLGK